MATSFKTYTLTVAEKVAETAETVTIRFKQPALKKVKYKAGQYITLIITINGRKYRRPYSISSVFGLDTTLNITVKAIPNGVVSNYIVHNMKVGDAIEVLEPLGHYTVEQSEKYKSIWCWSAGSGITPNYSIIKDILVNHLAIEEVVLVYSNKNFTNTIFKDGLELLQQQFPGRLSIHHIHTFPDELSVNTFHNSRINNECIRQLAEKLPADKGANAHFICGPQQMKELITSELASHGVSLGDIHSEDFHLLVDMAKLDKVVEAEVQLEFQNNLLQFTVKPGTSVLDACLDAGHDIPYSCQSGSCTLCKAVLLEGEMQKESQHEPDEVIGNDEILTCCSFPLTRNIKLKIQ